MREGQTPCLDSGLNTDLYELTMGAAFWKSGMADKYAVFELFVRSLPEHWGYLVSCGIQGALDFLETVHFDPDQIAWLAGLEAFSGIESGFWEAMASFRFRGNVWAVPEGRAVFAGEPILRVEAPLFQAQVVETALLARINFETLVATKAARVTEAAGGRPVVDFGTRRAHGPQAGMLAARASYVGGVAGTSNLCAGQAYDIPVAGTTAHSFVLAFDSEKEAFEAFASVFPGGSVLIADTYDPIEGTRQAASLNWPLKGVRLDGGDLEGLSRRVRALLDQAGKKDAKVLVSGDLDEDSIARLVASGAPVDSFGVGTRLVTGWSVPALGGVYKLVEIDGRPVAKRGADKATRPGVKQVFRVLRQGLAQHDVLALAQEEAFSLDVSTGKDESGGALGAQGAEPLLEQVMVEGRRVTGPEGPTVGRRRWAEERETLPQSVRAVRSPGDYEVLVSPALDELTRKVVGP